MSDVNAWFVERLNAAIPTSGTWTPHQIAEDLVAALRKENPKQFNEWLTAQATSHVHAVINQRLRSDRGRALSQQAASVFAKDAAAHADGDPKALDPYTIAYVIDESDGRRMALGDMTGKDCQTAAVPFHRRANENAMQAAFLEALAKKAGRRKVRNAVDRETLTQMVASVGGSRELVAA